MYIYRYIYIYIYMQGAAKVEKDSEDPTAEGVNPRPAKKQKSGEQIAIYNATNWCRSVIAGKSKGRDRQAPSTDEKDAAEAGLELLLCRNMDATKKNAFAAKMAESHKSKTYGWVKEFSSSWKSNKKETSSVVLNYLTRTADACMHAHMCIYVCVCVPVTLQHWCGLVSSIHSCTCMSVAG
jgi:hypothetical protein